MISATGTISRIEKDGGTDSAPSGIEALATALDGLYVSLALHCSAGKESVLYSHYVWRYPQVHLDRVTADAGTTSSIGHVSDVIASLRPYLNDCTLIVPCASGKASVLYAIDTTMTPDATLSEASVTAFTAESDFAVDGVPDISAERDADPTLISIDCDNLGASDIRIYRGVGVQSNFTVLTTASTVPQIDDPVVATTDYKYKASFVVTGTRNGIARTVEGQRSPARYVIAENSTV